MEERTPDSAAFSYALFMFSKAARDCTKRCNVLRPGSELDDGQKECLEICGNNAAASRWVTENFFEDFANRNAI